jgi:hypothetical protein
VTIAELRADMTHPRAFGSGSEASAFRYRRGSPEAGRHTASRTSISKFLKSIVSFIRIFASRQTP